jgi:hypothetical protein
MPLGVGVLSEPGAPQADAGEQEESCNRCERGYIETRERQATDGFLAVIRTPVTGSSALLTA